MRVLNGFARLVTALVCLYLWAVWADYLSECVPDVSFDHEITRVWWGRDAENIVLKENEWVSPGREYWETGYDYTYTFRLSEGAVLFMAYDGFLMTISEDDLRTAESAGGAPAEGRHTLCAGYDMKEFYLLDGKPLPAHCLRSTGGKGVRLKNTGTGEIALSDLLVEFPQWRNPRPMETREAPRTKEELLYRGKIWARYLIYSVAPPPLPIRARREGDE